MDKNYEQAHPMNSKEYKAVGLPETANTVKTRERQTIRRRLAGLALAAGTVAGFVGIPKLLGLDGTPTNEINNPPHTSTELNSTIIKESNTGTNDININIPPIQNKP